MDSWCYPRGSSELGKLLQELKEEALAFAQASFENQKEIGGASQREHIESLERQGKDVSHLIEELPECPSLYVPLWNDFMMLHSARTSNGYSMNPLGYAEILSYYTLRGFLPDAADIEILKEFDGVALKHFANESKKSQDQAKSKSKSKH